MELYSAIRNNEYYSLRSKFNDDGEELSLPQVQKDRLLLLAAELGHSRCCRILLGYGANVDCKNDYAETPLHLAAWNGHSECCVALLEEGAQSNLKNSSGWNVLQISAFMGNDDCVRTLINNGADPDCLRGFEDNIQLSEIEEPKKIIILDIIKQLHDDVAKEEKEVDDVKVNLPLFFGDDSEDSSSEDDEDEDDESSEDDEDEDDEDSDIECEDNPESYASSEDYSVVVVDHGALLFDEGDSSSS